MIRTKSAEDLGLSLALIQTNGGTQSRATLNDQVVDDYAEAIQAGATFPPIVVFYDGKKHWLADGFHRFHAYQKAGREKVATDVRQGTRRDAILHSVGANETHGLRRTNDDKRRAVLTLLDDTEWSKWSDGEIAKRCAVSREYVNRLRPKDTCDQVTGMERTFVHPKTGEPATMRLPSTAFRAENAQKSGGDEKQEITSPTVALQGGEGGDEPQKAVEEITPRNIFRELVALWKEASPGVRQHFKAYIKGNEAVAKLNSQSATPTAEQAVTDKPQAPRPSVTANNLAGPHSSAVSGGKPSTPSSDDGGAKMEQPGRAVPGQPGTEPAFVSTQSEQVASFKNPRCQNPETCHLAHTRNECFDCNLAWSKRPKDEQVRLWAEAVQAGRAA